MWIVIEKNRKAAQVYVLNWYILECRLSAATLEVKKYSIFA